LRSILATGERKATETVHHIDICERCGSLLVREVPRCLACGFNVATGEVELVEAMPASPMMPSWDDIVDAVAAPVAWLRAPRRRLHAIRHQDPSAATAQRGT
jgi:hypothetical protein